MPSFVDFENQLKIWECETCKKSIFLYYKYGEMVRPKGWSYYSVFQVYCPKCTPYPYESLLGEELDSQLIEFPLQDEVLADLLEERGYVVQAQKLRP